MRWLNNTIQRKETFRKNDIHLKLLMWNDIKIRF